MKILLVSAYFPPEIGAPAARAYELARRWNRMGHSVRVLTGFPNHPTGEIPQPYRGKIWRLVLAEVTEGVRVMRVWLVPAPNRRALERILNYGSFFLSSSVTGPWLSRPDVVVATSPHLLAGLTGWWLSRLFRVPFVLEIRDLWPESLVASGVAGDSSWLIRSVGRLAGFLYRRADRIVSVTEPIAEAIRRRCQPHLPRIAVIEHGVDGERFRPMEAPGWPDPLEDLDGHPVVSYIGTLGQAHDLGNLLQAAEQVWNEEPGIRFLLLGEGAEKEHLIAECKRRGLKNVRFLSKQPWERMPEFINRSAICLVCLKPDQTFQTVMPTKMLEYLACGRPVVLAGQGHVRRVLEASGGGVAVDPGDPARLASSIVRLARDPSLRKRLGEQGRRYVLGRFSMDRQAASYADLLKETLSP